MKQIKTAALAAALVLGLAGCDEATGPDQAGAGKGTVAVGVRGDGSPSGSSSGSSSRWSLNGGASGTVEVKARVFVQSRLGEWVEVTRGSAQQKVEASGSDGVKLLATARLTAGEYSRVRVAFERVQADVRGGITIGLGLLTGTVSVDGGSDGQVVVEREVEVEAEADSTTELEIDLNADQWLSRTNAQTRLVSEAEFQSAVKIVAR